MNTQPEALRLADALDAEFVQGRISNSTGRESAVELRRLHEALETEQEPVATVTSESGNPNLSMSWWHEPALPVGTKIYTSQPKAAEWVGLTADEIWECNKAKSGSAVEFHICYAHQNVLDFAEAIEAKLKEKNT